MNSGRGYLEQAGRVIDEHRLSCTRLVVGWQHTGDLYTIEADVQIGGQAQEVTIQESTQEDALAELRKRLRLLVD